MKPSDTRFRKPAILTNSRWLAYATAGAASAFTCASSAEADIHYSGLIKQTVRTNHHFSFPLGASGGIIRVDHIRHVYGSSSFYDGGSAFFGISAPAESVAGVYTRRGDVSLSKLEAQEAISAQQFLPRTLGFLAERSVAGGGGFPVGQFQERGQGFVGFRFNNGAGFQYGWARILMKGYPRFVFVLVDYAYGDPGDVVLAGQKHSANTTMNSLGGLALGAAGLMIWRRRRTKSNDAMMVPTRVTPNRQLRVRA